MLKYAATVTMKTPTMDHVYQTKSADMWSEYSPLKSHRKGTDAMK